MEESKQFYEVISKPIYSQYHDVWITVKNKDFLIKVPSTTDKSEKYLLKLATVKITNYLKKPQSPEKDFRKLGRPRKYQYTTETEAGRCWQEAYKKKHLLIASA